MFTEQLTKIIKKFPLFFAFFGLKDLQEDIQDDRDDVMGIAERFNWKVLKEDGAWEEVYKKLKWEVQKWMDCTGQAIKNIIEMLYWIKWKKKVNVSAAYINGMANTSKWKGNSLRIVLNSIRENGIVFDEDWPEENRWMKIPQSVIDKGKLWRKQYHFGYDNVLPTLKAMQHASKFSPLYGGGFAWKKVGMFYVSAGTPNHAFTKLETGDDKAGDSYDPHIKRLHPEYKFFWPKRIYIEKREEVFDTNKIKALKKRGFAYIQRTDRLNGGVGQVYELTANNEVVELNPQAKMERGIEGLAKRGDLTGISEKDYLNLLK